jgi:hypothetical protein
MTVMRTIISILAALFLAAPAYASGEDAIGRANLDGSDADQNFIPTSPFVPSLAVDGGHIYWANPNYRAGEAAYMIARANLDGSGVQETFIPVASPPHGIAVDGGHIYWTTSSSVGRANLDGSGVEDGFITTNTPIGALDVDGAHIYWVSATDATVSIARANVDGSGVEPHFIDLPGGGPGQGLAVDASHIYWTSAGGPNGAAIARANLDGSGIEPDFLSVQSFPTGVAVDASHVYFSTAFQPDGASIGRANLDGSAVDPNFITGASRPGDVAVDAGHVYWANQLNPEMPPHGDDDNTPPRTVITDGPPNRTHKHRVTFEFDSNEAAVTFTCRLDRRQWNACTSPTTVRHLRHGKHRFYVRAIDSSDNLERIPAKYKFKVVG